MHDALVALIIAPLVGSFLGFLVARLPYGRPVIFARSACDICGHSLGPLSLIPIFSYCLLRGRCHYCRNQISPFHLNIEMTAVLPVPCVAYAVGSDPVLLWAGLLLSWTLLGLSWIDWRHMLLPDSLTLSLLLLGFAATWIIDPAELSDHALASAIGYLSMRAVAILFKWVRGNDGLGAGDAKLLGAGGAWVGTSDLAAVVLIGSITALLALAVMKFVQRQAIETSTRVPFGPWLSIGIWACWLSEQTQFS